MTYTDEKRLISAGLTTTKAKGLLQKNGKNELRKEKKHTPLKIFINQYKDIMTVILLTCTVISIFLGDYFEAIAIAVIVLINGILGFLQEYKTEKAIENLKKLSSPTSKVYRDGVLCVINSDELVVGDIILLEAGDKVPADCMVVQSVHLKSDESILTGESMEVSKTETDLNDTLNNDLNQDNIVYMGCSISGGRGMGKVINTGMSTQMGNIAQMLDSITQELTPLSKKLEQLSKYIAVGCIAICLIISITGIIKGENLFDMLITGVSLAVAAVPEGLAAIVTIALALAVMRMAKKKAIVRRLYAVESLGCAGVICSDKTGTLTQNKMTITNWYLPDTGVQQLKEKIDPDISHSMGQLLNVCRYCCNIKDERTGSATELALDRFARLYNGDKKSVKEFTRIDEIPFDSVRKMMSVVVKNRSGDHYVYTKGAVDYCLNKCTHILTEKGVTPLTETARRDILKANEEMSGKALRCLSTAYKPYSKGEPIESELIFIGLVGMIDPPRKEVKKAVATCKKAGINVIMITGDHKSTAFAIGRDIGICDKQSQVKTGAEIDLLTEEQLRDTVKHTKVFARVSPKNKLQIVKAIKANGQIVAMTGDGVNDAPAIKEADIGVSMGITGSDVTKEASSIILLDDNFSTLVTAVCEGRSIYANIRKFIRYLLACNIGEVLTMFVGMLMGLPVVLLPLQILLVNLVTDGLPAIALGVEPTDESVMRQKPRDPNSSVFSNGLGFKIVIRGIFIGICTLASFILAQNATGSVEVARTCAFITLIFSQLLHVFECKSEEKSIFTVPYFNNLKLILAVLTSLAVTLVVVYNQSVGSLFGTVPLDSTRMLIAIACSVVVPILSAVFNFKGKE